MSNGVQIVQLRRQPRDVHRFLQVSYAIYRDDPFWVAPLLLDIKKVFSDRNPFFQHAEMSLWIATLGGRDVGRIAGIIDRAYNEYQSVRAAFFGFFECINDPQASRALFQAAFEWARQKDLQRILGPMNPTNNDECGLLVEGFDSAPAIMMSYNPRYYVELIAAEGFQKAKDLLAFHIEVSNTPQERLERIAVIFGRRQQDLDMRMVLRKNLKKDLAKINEVYNEAWQKNWGFVPMTDAEISYMAERLKPILMEGLVWIAESPKEPAGFILALPDFNEAIQPLKGRLLTSRLIGFLPYLLGRKRPRRIRLIALGVKKKYRGRGIESVMFAQTFQVLLKAGLKACEASWILEDNIEVQRVIELFGGKPYKTYRIYERSL